MTIRQDKPTRHEDAKDDESFHLRSRRARAHESTRYQSSCTAFCQEGVHCRFPVGALLFGPMRIQFGDLFVTFRSESRVPISNGCLAAFLAVGDDSDLDLICGKARHYDHILNTSFFRLVGGEHPKPFLTIGAVDGEDSALAL